MPSTTPPKIPDREIGGATLEISGVCSIEEPMISKKLFVVTLGCVLVLFASASAEVSRPKVVAAENFYGDGARQIRDRWFEVSSIMSSPNQDPHLFEVTPAIALQLSAAKIVILN